MKTKSYNLLIPLPMASNPGGESDIPPRCPPNDAIILIASPTVFTSAVFFSRPADP